MKGFCKFFDSTRGFGFVCEEDTKRIFLSFLWYTWKVVSSDQVEFELEEGKRDLRAIEIRRIKTNENGK